MDSSDTTKSSSRASDSQPLDFEAGLPTTAADVAALRALRARRVPGLLERIDDLSAETVAAEVPARRRTHAGFEPFRL